VATTNAKGRGSAVRQEQTIHEVAFSLPGGIFGNTSRVGRVLSRVPLPDRGQGIQALTGLAGQMQESSKWH
jgi:hypothetical protein